MSQAESETAILTNSHRGGDHFGEITEMVGSGNGKSEIAGFKASLEELA